MRRRYRDAAGVTLIEMMVALVISMVLSIVVMLVLSTFEGRRRTISSGADLDQTGALAMFQLDRWIRSAGSGLAQGSSYAYGCRLFAAKAGNQILPAPAALPAPFASVNPGASGVFRLAPILILPGQTTPEVSGASSDVLVVMTAGNRASQVPAPLLAPPAADHLSTANLTEFAPSDLVLVADRQQNTDGGPADCLVSQTAASLPTTGAGTLLALGGTGDAYYAASVGTAAITNFTDAAVAFDLGAASNAGGGQTPVFQLLGVGNHDTLYSYDLLQIDGNAAQAEAEGVFEMHAVYGVDATGNANNQVDQWVDASATSAYSVAALTDGSAAAMGLLKNIRAVRVALILRTSLPEKDTVAPSELALFPDLSGVARTRVLSAAERHFRYRVVETTIPVRNNAF